MGQLLTPDFLVQYNGKSPFPNPFSEFIYLRTYSRWVEEKKRRETWQETVERVVEYSFTLYSGHRVGDLREEAQRMYENVFWLRWTPSGRSLWVAGTSALSKGALANWNCSGLLMDSIRKFEILFYALMVGTGVGFSVQKKDIEKLPDFNQKILLETPDVEFVGYESPLYTEETYTHCSIFDDEDQSVSTLTIGDSREGWSRGLKDFLELMAQPKTRKILLNLSSVRPQGDRLKTFGGRASGSIPYKNMIQKIHKVITTAPTGKLRPIDVMDICNIIGENVVCGGTRRSSEICVFDENDEEIAKAKVGMWDDPQRDISHRRMSNNSIFFWEKPTLESLLTLKDKIRSSWEPGFMNAQAASLKRPWFDIFNPCAESELSDYGVCNLISIFIISFVKDGMLDMALLRKIIQEATQHNLRITNANIEVPEMDYIQKRDRLLGVNITGWEDMIEACLDRSSTPSKHGYDGRKIWCSQQPYGTATPQVYTMTVDALKVELRKCANAEAERYAFELRVPVPLLVTLIQPSGSLSLLKACSPGAHKSFAPYYIRRVRVNSFDALAKTCRVQGYRIFPEVGNGITSGEFKQLTKGEQDAWLDKVDTWVVEFVVKSLATSKAEDESALSQYKRYLSYQLYTDHTTSITIQVGDSEWEKLFKKIHDTWDQYIAVSFQAKSNTAYDLQPYEAIDEDEYYFRLADCPEIDQSILNDIENGVYQADTENLESCQGASCPVR